MHARYWPPGPGFRVVAYLLPGCLIALSAHLATNCVVVAQEIGGACTGSECASVGGCRAHVGNGCDCSECGYHEGVNAKRRCVGATGGCGLAQCGCAMGLGCKSGNCGGDGTHCGLPAPSYPVPFATPRPTTPTYFTYPPMMPHNSLPHYRSTYSFRHGPGLSRTEVHWRSKKLLNLADYLHHVIEIPR